MRAAIYSRVSTNNGQQSPQMQISELRDYALNKLMADAHQRRFDAVLIWKLDRFGRSLRHLVNALAEFEALGIAFVSLRDNLDLSTPSGRLMFQIIGAMAEFERSLIQERVRAGIRAARAKGRRLGRPRAAVDAAKITCLRTQGCSIRDIAAELGCSRSLVHKTLANGSSTGVASTAG